MIDMEQLVRDAASSAVAGSTAAGSTAAGSRRADSTPAGLTPAGLTPAGSMPAGSMPAGSMPAGSTAGGADAAAEAARRLTARVCAEGLVDVTYAVLESPFGRLIAATTEGGLVRLAFPEESEDSVLERLAARISPRIVESPGALDAVRRELEEYFTGSRQRFELALDWSLIGPFAQRVLRATYAIPYGGVSTYAEVAAQAGSPRGSRAAGNALGSNPIPIVIPCHRVLRTGGSLGGYGGGLDRKRHLLTLEGALEGALPA